MKLKDWADKQGIAYLTAWRWFKAGDPRLSNAYQSDSGTIIVPEDADTMEQPMGTTQTNDVMSAVLKKTVELSKSNASVEDFAAWILSNYSLKPNHQFDGPKYSRNKPKSEEVQKHFQQFIKPKGEKPKSNMFVASPEALDDLIAKSDNLTAQELVDEINKVGVEGGVSINATDAPEVEELMKDLSSALNTPSTMVSSVVTYSDVAEGVVARSIELTPQLLNYTGSIDSAFGNYLADTPSITVNSMDASTPTTIGNQTITRSIMSGINTNTSMATFKPTQKELESASKVSAIADRPKRGRKSKNTVKK